MVACLTWPVGAGVDGYLGEGLCGRMDARWNGRTITRFRVLIGFECSQANKAAAGLIGKVWHTSCKSQSSRRLRHHRLRLGAFW